MILHLQQIRLHRQAEINFNINCDQDGLMVAPLLFIIMLENAFKHGIEPAEDASYLKVELSVLDRILVFTCQNSLYLQI